MNADLVELPGARVLFSTRQGGVSEGPYESLNLGLLTDDEPARVAENRRRVAAAAAVEPERVGMGLQVHGSDLLDWTAPPPERAYAEPGGKELPRVDGHLTSEPELGLLVLVADCYPVALSDGQRAAMLHCGWRPLAGGIVEKAVAALRGHAGGRRRARDRRLLLRGRPRGACRVRRPRRGGAGAHARPSQGDRPPSSRRPASNASSTSTAARAASRSATSPTAATAA